MTKPARLEERTRAMDGYWALLHGDEEAVGISFPDVPGCVSAGDTAEAAIRNGQDALSAHLALLRSDGDAIPSPRSLTKLQSTSDVTEIAEGGMWHLIVPRIVQAPRLRVNIMIDPGVLRDADAVAEARGMTRSGLIEEALQRQALAATGGARTKIGMGHRVRGSGNQRSGLATEQKRKKGQPA